MVMPKVSRNLGGREAGKIITPVWGRGGKRGYGPGVDWIEHRDDALRNIWVQFREWSSSSSQGKGEGLNCRYRMTTSAGKY